MAHIMLPEKVSTKSRTSNRRRKTVSRLQIRSPVSGAILFLAVLVIPAVSAAAESSDASRDAASVTEGQARNAKADRLRFRPVGGSCTCTCAKGGTRESEIKQAEEARARADH